MEPRELAEQAEGSAAPPPGEGERFAGYGVMGLPFASGHVLDPQRHLAVAVRAG